MDTTDIGSPAAVEVVRLYKKLEVILMARLGVFAFAAVAASSFAATAFAADRLVPSQYATIQAAIDASVAGDTVLVSPDAYVGQINMRGKAITLKSTGGASVTTISPGSAGGAVVTCNSGETSACVIDGFSISGATNGSGVAIVSASPRFKFCEIKNNTNSSSNGAGANISGTTASPQFEDCFFFGNYANGREGGAISDSASGAGASLTCLRCKFQQNEVVNGSYGGAVHFSGNAANFVATFTSCEFTLNTITASDSFRYGGAIFSGAPLVLSDCRFDRNSVFQTVGNPCGDVHSRGGAVYCSSSISATNCAFIQNMARSTPHGGYCGGASYARGGAVYLDSAAAASFSFCSFTQNTAMQPLGSCGGYRVAQGGALFCGAGVDPIITGCTFSENRAEMCGGGNGGAIFYEGGSEGTITDSTFSSCYAGYGGGALLIAGNAGPLVKRCTFSTCTTPSTGTGGAVRIDGGSYLSTFRDCRFTSCTSGSGGAAWVQNNRSLFDRCTFDHNTAPSGSAMLTLGTGSQNIPIVCYSSFCSNSGTSTNWLSGLFSDAHPAQPTNNFSADCGGDCNGNGIIDTIEIAAGLADCDGDGIPNVCEITDGASDCDADGIPDACEIADGASDCDADGIPDACEIAGGDANNDGILDACQTVYFAGLVSEIRPITDVINGLPSSAVCWRVYATLSTQGATVSAIWGDSVYPMSFSATGDFFQSASGGNLGSQNPCVSADPSLKYDSFLTLGGDCIATTSASAQGMNFTAFESTGGAITLFDSANGGSVYQIPGVQADENGRVLLMQLTTKTGVKPNAIFNLIGDNASTVAGNWWAYGLSIPNPVLVDCNSNGTHDAIDIANGLARDCDHTGVPDSCEYSAAIANADCDGDGVYDLCEIYIGTEQDVNNNGLADDCECLGDVDGNGAVNVRDLLAIIVAWGDPSPNAADLDGDGVVGSGDLTLVLQGWGSCL